MSKSIVTNILYVFFGIDYINLISEHHIENHSKKLLRKRKKLPCYVYQKKVTACRNSSCDHAKLTAINAKEVTKNGKEINEPYKICPKCGLVYVPLSVYLEKEDTLECMNPHQLSVMKTRAEEKRKKNEQKSHLHDNQKHALQSHRKDVKQKVKKHGNSSSDSSVKTVFLSQNNNIQKNERTEYHVKKITVRDCIVRRNVFKCRNNRHSLENVNATVPIINSRGDIQHVTIPAGYCSDCNLFFIMESTYQNLRERGTPMCKVSNEKAYLNSSNCSNKMHLAQQSILMQYGYNVSQQESLTETQRQKILSTLVDHEILTKGEIISYLDFFIRQRQ